MKDIIVESLLLEIRVPSNQYECIFKIAEDKELSVNAVILHFISMGLMTYNTLVKPVENDVKEIIEKCSIDVKKKNLN